MGMDLGQIHGDAIEIAEVEIVLAFTEDRLPTAAAIVDVVLLVDREFDLARWTPFYPVPRN